MSELTINRERLLNEFIHLTTFDAPSYHEKEIAGYVKNELKCLGLRVEEDSAYEKLLAEDPARTDTASNIYAYLDGTDKESEPILFSAHLDTVSPGIGKKAVVHEDGTITSSGDTVLGADDAAGLSAILEALRIITENNIPHPPIEILFSVAEEPFCIGSRFFEYDRLKAKEGYVLDLTGPVGTAANAAPSVVSLDIEIKGRAAHAGFSPENGINALTIASEALSKIKTGRVEEDLTVNFGTIQGGNGRNIVPEYIKIQGEIRAGEHAKVLKEAERIRDVFESAAEKADGKLSFSVTENIRAYRIPEERPVVKRFIKAASGVPGVVKPRLITTYGGSDANRLNEHGIETIVAATAMENCHSSNEYTTVPELERAALLTLRLMTDVNIEK